MNVNLGMLVRDWLRKKKLPFHIYRSCAITPSEWWHINRSDGRGRASIYDGQVIIYNVNPNRHYTAIGDQRCVLDPKEPDFFEKLKYHLSVENVNDA